MRKRLCLLECIVPALLASTGCHDRGATGADGGLYAKKPGAQLPAPFSDVRLGMTQAELQTVFPPVEDISRCAAQLVGGDSPMPPHVPGADKKAQSHCARSVDIGGLTFGEVAEIAKNDGDVSSGDPVDVQEGELYTYAHIRGAIRAGIVPETALLEADHGKSMTAYDAVGQVEHKLFKGGLTFARAHDSRRELCALIADSCDDMDPDRVRKYMVGSYSLDQIDADAHSRVVYGKCRQPYLQHERTLATRFVRREGAFGGVGLARASRTDHKLDPDNPSTFWVYSSRSGLDGNVAKFGVKVANAIPAVEEYWRGAVALIPPAGSNDSWASAVAWLRDGHVTRVLLNIGDDAKLGELPALLANVYGNPGRTSGAITTWSLRYSVKATLDIGASTSVVVETLSERSILEGAL